MPRLNLLIKPASSLCNLRCKYCFYHSSAKIRKVESNGLMELELLELIVKKALDFADVECNFAFQGGEPTLAGLDFYKKLIEFQKKYNLKKVKINNSLQTNGILIDRNWAEFLKKNNFLIGLSLDGTKDIHNTLRQDLQGKGTFSKVMNTVELFNRHMVEYNILFVVTSSVARHVESIYNSFVRKNFRYLQFIPCIEPLNEKPGGYDFSLTPEMFAGFLKRLFDLWDEDIRMGKYTSIRYFDDLIRLLTGQQPEICGMSGTCSSQIIIESDGGVYPCDFYVIDEWYLGSIKDKGFEELKYSENGRRFVEVSRPVNPECLNCKWINLCKGGCRRYREPFAGGMASLNYYCSSYKEFFEYAVPRLQNIDCFLRRILA